MALGGRIGDNYISGIEKDTVMAVSEVDLNSWRIGLVFASNITGSLYTVQSWPKNQAHVEVLDESELRRSMRKQTVQRWGEPLNRWKRTNAVKFPSR